MGKVTSEKLNRSGSSHAGRTIRVLASEGFYGAGRLSAVGRVIFNALYTFAQKGNPAEFSFSELSERYNVSYSSVARQMKRALGANFKRGDRACTYELKDLPPAPARYFYIPDWLRFAQFPSGEETTDLTNDQIEVLAYILHQNKHVKFWNRSQAGIARDLEVAPSTVSAAIAALEKLNLITVKISTARSRCANHYEHAFYVPNNTALQEARENTLTHLKAISRAARDADGRTERERFYEARRALANSHADLVRKKLGTDLTEIERQIGLLELQIAKAQHEARLTEAAALIERRLETSRAMHDFLADHGYTEEDLAPRWICPDCHDTGWRIKDGKPCGCFSPGGTP